MLPPDEFFQMPYFKKKSKRFKGSSYIYDAKYSAENVHKSIVNMFKEWYIVACREGVKDLFLSKVSNAAYLELTESDLKYIKGE